MGRHATASSRSAQKWQVAGNRNSDSSSEVVRVAVDRPCEEKVATRPSEEKVGGSTPTASPTSATLISKSEDRERWADIDIESDGEPVEFDGKYYGDEGKGDGWSVSGKRGGRIRPKVRERAAKPDPPAPSVSARPTREAFAPSRQASTKAEVSSTPTPYRPPKGDSRKTSQQDHHYESSSNHHWEASSWGTSGSGWKSSSKSHGSSWDSGTWDQKQDRSSDSHKHRGKQKNESFKRGPSVATNMDASRLAW